MKQPRQIIQTDFCKSIDGLDYHFCRQCNEYRNDFRKHAIKNRVSLCKVCQSTIFKRRLGEFNNPKRILFNLKQYSRRHGLKYGRYWELSDVVNRLSTAGINWELVAKLIYIRPIDKSQPFTLTNSIVLVAHGLKPRFKDVKQT
jgi:hypothetical protein